MSSTLQNMHGKHNEELEWVISGPCSNWVQNDDLGWTAQKEWWNCDKCLLNFEELKLSVMKENKIWCVLLFALFILYKYIQNMGS